MCVKNAYRPHPLLASGGPNGEPAEKSGLEREEQRSQHKPLLPDKAYGAPFCEAYFPAAEQEHCPATKTDDGADRVYSP